MTTSGHGDLLAGRSCKDLLRRRSFIELAARDRAAALLDDGSMEELAGPFDRLESPWLAPQGITPQADDGTVVARGTVGGHPVVIASIEQRFQGGGTGEVSGAKITQLLRLAADASRAGTPTAAVLLLETGGVRLQEANLGLNAVAEICSAVLDLRPLAPVIGMIAGTVGCFGGMSIAAGLCTRLIVTPQARLGLNGPAVIEQEAGAEEFDASDHALIWAIDGGAQRRATGLADELVYDDAAALRAALRRSVDAGAGNPATPRSRRLNELAARVAAVDPQQPPDPHALRRSWSDAEDDRVGSATRDSQTAESRGARWLRALSTSTTEAVIPSVLRSGDDAAVLLSVVPDPDSPYRRARKGEVGLAESLALARAVRDVVDEDADREVKRAIVAVVDLPSQAYGRVEEMVGLHHAMAVTVDAYHRARVTGHPVIALVVGKALSGGFLTHGLQANQILALDDPGVEIHAMHREAAARITRRTVGELDELATTVLPMSYDVRDWAQLGLCDALIAVDDADAPTPTDVRRVVDAIAEAVGRARRGPRDLSNRISSDHGALQRNASRTACEVMTRQWSRRSRATEC